MTGNSSIEIRSVGIPVSLPISCSFDDQSMVPASVIFSDQNATTPSSILCTTPTLSPGTHFVSIYVLGRRASMNQVALNVTIFCPQGTYLPSRRNIASSTGCLSCPFGALCVGGLEDPVSLPGFSPSPVVGKMFLECFVPESCVGNNTCGIGYVGPRCAFCAPSFVSVNGKCVICDSNASGWIAFGILLCVCLAPLWWLSRAVWNASSASFGNLLMFVQVIGLFDKYPLTWNPYLGGIVKAMSITILNTDYINLQCAFGLTYYPRLLLVWALPLIFGGIFLGYSWIFARFESKKHNRAFTESSQKWRRFSWNGFFSFLCLFHIPLTDRALKLFTCISDPYDDRFYIPGSPSVTCYDDKYFAYRPLAFVLSFVYGAGIPAFIFFTLFRHRKQLHEEQVVQRLSIVYSSYSESTWYWTPCQMMWSLVFMMLPVIFKRHPSYLMFISICLMYTYLFAVVTLESQSPLYFLMDNNHYFSPCGNHPQLLIFDNFSTAPKRG
ncbi:hypothetical protein DFJ73DRAFT_347713 [Zopfochytrium polystomum]|nr:hypothetical protein DFJ73DRAFT_347713 [Zopfochytrium polystomum]